MFLWITIKNEVQGWLAAPHYPFIRKKLIPTLFGGKRKHWFAKKKSSFCDAQNDPFCWDIFVLVTIYKNGTVAENLQTIPNMEWLCSPFNGCWSELEPVFQIILCNPQLQIDSLLFSFSTEIFQWTIDFGPIQLQLMQIAKVLVTNSTITYRDRLVVASSCVYSVDTEEKTGHHSEIKWQWPSKNKNSNYCLNGGWSYQLDEDYRLQQFIASKNKKLPNLHVKMIC